MFLGKPNALHYHEKASGQMTMFCFVYYFNKLSFLKHDIYAHEKTFSELWNLIKIYSNQKSV